MFEAKPYPPLEGRLRAKQRRADPGQFIADDDFLRRNAEGAQPVANHLQGQTGAILAGGVEYHRPIRVLDYLAQDGQFGVQ